MTESATPPADVRSHFAIDDVAAAVTIQAGAVVSKVVYRDEIVNVTVFGLDAGQELTEHRAARPALVQVLAGRLHFNANGEEFDAGPGFWLHTSSGTPHALVAAARSRHSRTDPRPGHPVLPGDHARPSPRPRLRRGRRGGLVGAHPDVDRLLVLGVEWQVPSALVDVEAKPVSGRA